MVKDKVGEASIESLVIYIYDNCAHLISICRVQCHGTPSCSRYRIHRYMMDMLPSSLQVQQPLGTDMQALDSTTHPPSYPTRLTEVQSRSARTVLHSPALEPINKAKQKKKEYEYSKTNG
jgi:hypothetical protein